MTEMEELGTRIANCRECKEYIVCGENRFWQFPNWRGVKGFLGDKDYIFVGSQPHEGDFPATHLDQRLYDNLAKYGFNEAHLTDMVKCRGKKYKELTDTDVRNCVRWLNEEVRTVKPKAVIALGDKSYSILLRYYRSSPPIVRLNHYSDYAISNFKYEKQFEALRYLIDSNQLRLGMIMKEQITPQDKKNLEKQSRFKSFNADLTLLRSEGKISEEQRRELADQWESEPEKAEKRVELLKSASNND